MTKTNLIVEVVCGIICAAVPVLAIASFYYPSVFYPV